MLVIFILKVTFYIFLPVIRTLDISKSLSLRIFEIRLYIKMSKIIQDGITHSISAYMYALFTEPRSKALSSLCICAGSIELKQVR